MKVHTVCYCVRMVDEVRRGKIWFAIQKNFTSVLYFKHGVWSHVNGAETWSAQAYFQTAAHSVC